MIARRNCAVCVHEEPRRIGQSWIEFRQFNHFQFGRCPPSWIWSKVDFNNFCSLRGPIVHQLTKLHHDLTMWCQVINNSTNFSVPFLRAHFTQMDLRVAWCTPCRMWGNIYCVSIKFTLFIFVITRLIINRFLANVNSSSCSLYVIVRPSVVCRLSVVCL